VHVKSLAIQGVRERSIKYLNNIPFLFVAETVLFRLEFFFFCRNAIVAIKKFIYCVQCTYLSSSLRRSEKGKNGFVEVGGLVK